MAIEEIISFCLVQCNSCNKQYIGKTKRRLKDRFNKHRRTVDKQTNISKPTAVSEHFLSNDHTATDMQLIPLEIVKRIVTVYEKLEKHILLREVRPLNLLGLNRRDET